ncbi:hypothetical protein [uncultured Endozoicomonas sp.]|uniref:hypothetical protein n=1 Tax=uncultured Endozoicomonas sp. TaxID=432652 RepID=UPI002629CD13|nr:hypothetical protein [uncultured Endozoicomonas sp.]
MSDSIGSAGSSPASFTNQAQGSRAQVPELDDQGNATDPTTGVALSKEEFNDLLKELRMQAVEDSQLAKALRELEDKLAQVSSSANAADPDNSDEATKPLGSVVTNVFNGGV